MVFVTDDKWILQPGGVLDIDDEKVILAASTDGKLVKASLAQALDMMEKDEPDKYQKFHAQMEIQAGGVRLTKEQIVAMAISADDKFRIYDEATTRYMNVANANQIRRWRIEGHHSWRAIARESAKLSTRMPDRIVAWGWWSPVSNQLAGMSLCKAAAELLNEDYRKDPWN